MSEISRRNFIVRSTGAGAVGLSTLSKTTAGPRPNNRIRAAVVGVKGRGRDHIMGLTSQKDVEVAVLCDVDENVLNQRAREFESKHGKRPRVVTDLRRILDDQGIDVVTFATPNHWHALGTIWACQAGKDVYIEKPLSHNIWEGRKLVEATRNYGRIVQHGTQVRSSEAVREGIAKLREGVIGDLYMAKGLCYKFRNTIGRMPDAAVPSGVNYDMWLGPAPARPFSKNRFHYNWHWHWDYGNGDIGNQGVHQMDIARWGLGVGLPTKIQAMGDHFMFNDDQETPNTLLATFHYPSEKKMLVFEVRHWITNAEDMGDEGNSIGVIFYGTEGIMIIPSYGSYKTFLGKNREPGPSSEARGDHYGNFVEAVRSRRTEDLHANVEEGHQSASLCHLANIAYRTGQTVTFDPVTETFPADRQANTHLSRSYRAPYGVPDRV